MYYSFFIFIFPYLSSLQLQTVCSLIFYIWCILPPVGTYNKCFIQPSTYFYKIRYPLLTPHATYKSLYATIHINSHCSLSPPFYSVGPQFPALLFPLSIFVFCYFHKLPVLAAAPDILPASNFYKFLYNFLLSLLKYIACNLPGYIPFLRLPISSLSVIVLHLLVLHVFYVKRPTSLIYNLFLLFLFPLPVLAAAPDNPFYL